MKSHVGEVHSEVTDALPSMGAALHTYFRGAPPQVGGMTVTSAVLELIAVEDKMRAPIQVGGGGDAEPGYGLGVTNVSELDGGD